MIRLEYIGLDTHDPLTTIRAVCTICGRTITERTYDVSKPKPDVQAQAIEDTKAALRHEYICTKEKPCEPTC